MAFQITILPQKQNIAAVPGEKTEAVGQLEKRIDTSAYRRTEERHMALFYRMAEPVRELDNAQNDMPGELNGYEPPYHDFNGITSKFGAHFILKVDRILMKKKYSDATHMKIINDKRAKEKNKK